MRPTPAFIAALPREVSGLVKGWERRRIADGVVVYSNGEAVVACAGMGASRVALAVRAAMDALKPAVAALEGSRSKLAAWASIGFAGVVVFGWIVEAVVKAAVAWVLSHVH